MATATSAAQDRSFIESIISSRLLEDAIDWIICNMPPEDVYSEDDLKTWALDHGFTEEP